MDADRIKEIQEQTAYPESMSVYKALLQVWNECTQEDLRINGESMRKVPFINESFYKYSLQSIWGVGFLDLGQYEGDFYKWYKKIGKPRFEDFSITEDVLAKDFKNFKTKK